MFDPTTLSLSDVERKIYWTEEAHNRRTGVRPYLLKRFLGLSIAMQEIAAYGIKRHIYYCDKLDVACGLDGIREIIDDTIKGYSQAEANEQCLRRDKDAPLENERNYMRLFNESGRSYRKRKTPIFS